MIGTCLHNRDIVPDDCCLAYDDTTGVVHEDTRADPGSWVYVHCKYLQEMQRG